jgi:hypothetical protein
MPKNTSLTILAPSRMHLECSMLGVLIHSFGAASVNDAVMFELRELWGVERE